MKATYIETSALLAWLFGERGAESVAKALESTEAIVTSALTFVEAERLIHRALADRRVKEFVGHRLRASLIELRSRTVVLALTDDLLERAARPFPNEPVRTLDALHLASALAFAAAYSDLAVLSLDRRIVTNARDLGLSVG